MTDKKERLVKSCRHFWLPLRTIHFKKWEKRNNFSWIFQWVEMSEVELVYCAKCGKHGYVDSINKNDK